MDKIGIVSTVKVPVAQLLLFIHYHLNIGVDCIVLYFDDPDDEGFDVLSTYSQVHGIKCTFDYWGERTGAKPGALDERQVVNVNEGAKLLSSLQCDWLIHIDTDELLNPLTPLNDYLSGSAADMVKFSMYEAVSEKNEYHNIFMPTLFKKKSNRWQIRIASLLGCTNAIFDGKYFRGHTASKVAVRIGPKVKEYNIHKARMHEGAVMEMTNHIQLLHYDCVGFNDWKLKWDTRLGDPEKVLSMSNNRRKQETMYENRRSGGESQLLCLYRKLYLFGKKETIILSLLRMLKRIELDQTLFEIKR